MAPKKSPVVNLAELAPPSAAASLPGKVNGKGGTPSLIGHVRDALDAGPCGWNGLTGVAAVEAAKDLRRCAQQLGCGLKVRFSVDGNSVKATDVPALRAVDLTFNATSGKASTRRYTTADVRTWAGEQGIELPVKGRVPREVSAKFREAHGL